MTYLNCTKILVAGAALSLVACGGGGGHVNSTPTPTPTPAPPPAPTPAPTTAPIIGQAATSQQFAATGAAGMSIAQADQLAVRYDAATQTYEIQLPPSTAWKRLSLSAYATPNTTYFTTQDGIELLVQEGTTTGYDYSALAYWTVGQGSSATKVGAVAFGIPTAAGDVPITGSATFNGSIFGQTNEPSDSVIGDTGFVTGDIQLAFNFGTGSLSGSISPVLYLGGPYNLPSMQFTNTVYSTGSTTFSGEFATGLSGANSFSGLFTGPGGQELIGNFIFPYKSPEDNHSYEAAGAFVAKDH